RRRKSAAPISDYKSKAEKVALTNLVYTYLVQRILTELRLERASAEILGKMNEPPKDVKYSKLQPLDPAAFAKLSGVYTELCATLSIIYAEAHNFELMLRQLEKSGTKFNTKRDFASNAVLQNMLQNSRDLKMLFDSTISRDPKMGSML